MPKVKLDAAFIATARCEPGKRKTDYYDTNITGLVLEVRASGGRTFYLRFQNQYGAQKALKIASAGDVSWDRVRKEAMRLKSQVVLGGDPLADKAQKRAIQTFAELAEMQIQHTRGYARSAKNVEGCIRKWIIPKFGAKRLDEVTRREVTQWLSELDAQGLAPATVEKIRVTMGKAFQLAIDWDLPGSGKNPTRGIKRPPLNNARNRVLSKEETERLHLALAASSNPQLKAIVGLLILTGARLREILDAKKSAVNRERRTLHIAHSKSGVARTLPLADAAMAIIEGLPVFEKCEWLIPNPDTLKPYVSIKRSWAAATKAAGISGFRLHDCRHHAATLLADAGIPLYSIGKLLGHADHRSTQRYAAISHGPLAQAVEAGAAGLGIDWA